ncbi:hypothetical protein [Pelagibaculum spongiae]|uniref:Uncharacterized protein n=1 Tax=Pelagibaculum spongiae TaxID=2080658 RepID=A0A2V1GUD7_9GAMM|nr:hypothetical protein [Pelagibaculum spongiae]PVZ66287.1 hypothetical protein DC094_16415 [Pelagibaculum spongiae]
MITINSVRRQHQGSISISGLCKPSRLKARWLLQEAMIAARSGGLLLIAPPRWVQELLAEMPAYRDKVLQVFSHPKYSQSDLLHKALQQSPCRNIWVWGDQFSEYSDSRLICFSQYLTAAATDCLQLRESAAGLRISNEISGRFFLMAREPRGVKNPAIKTARRPVFRSILAPVLTPLLQQKYMAL